MDEFDEQRKRMHADISVASMTAEEAHEVFAGVARPAADGVPGAAQPDPKGGNDGR